MLHMRGMDISPTDLRTDVRAFLLQPGGAAFCQGLRGLSDDEIAATLHAAEAGSSSTVLPPGATAVPGQTPFPLDARAAAQIVKDECARVAP